MFFWFFDVTWHLVTDFFMFLYSPSYNAFQMTYFQQTFDSVFVGVGVGDGVCSFVCLRVCACVLKRQAIKEHLI